MKRFSAIWALGLVGTYLLAGDSHFLRVEVNQQEGSQVNLRIPLSMIPAFEDSLRQALEEVEVQSNGIRVREIWQAVRDAGPTNFVEMQSEEGRILISTTDEWIQVQADGQLQEKVTMQIPLSLCDALFTDAESVDLQNVVAILESMAGKDLVRVDTDDADVRIWVE
jgi:hypothetical protein